MIQASTPPITFTYQFFFNDETKAEYAVKLDPINFSIINPINHKVPEWCRLDNNKCENCPLKSTQVPFCPVARHLHHLVENFNDKLSEDEVHVKVIGPERTYTKRVPIQVALSSIFGLIMPVSGCQHLVFLRPMARYHLPFSTPEETIIRSTSYYLLGQYFIAKNNKPGDFKLKHLENHYLMAKKVNEGILNRIKSIARQDADPKAILLLQNISQILTNAIDGDLLKVEPVFTSIIVT